MSLLNTQIFYDWLSGPYVENSMFCSQVLFLKFIEKYPQYNGKTYNEIKLELMVYRIFEFNLRNEYEGLPLYNIMLSIMISSENYYSDSSYVISLIQNNILFSELLNTGHLLPSNDYSTFNMRCRLLAELFVYNSSFEDEFSNIHKYYKSSNEDKVLQSNNLSGEELSEYEFGVIYNKIQQEKENILLPATPYYQNISKPKKNFNLKCTSTDEP